MLIIFVLQNSIKFLFTPQKNRVG